MKNMISGLSEVSPSQHDLFCSIRGFYNPLVLPETVGTPRLQLSMFKTICPLGIPRAFNDAMWSVHSSYVVYCH